VLDEEEQKEHSRGGSIDGGNQGKLTPYCNDMVQPATEGNIGLMKRMRQASLSPEGTPSSGTDSVTNTTVLQRGTKCFSPPQMQYCA